MKVRIHNRQQRIRVDADRLRELAVGLFEQARRGRPLALDELHVDLTDHAGMRQAHARVFGRPKDTDVVSQAYAPMPGGPAEAEIVLNVEQALEVGARRRGDADRELALYLAHGIDHLHGADDRTAEERARMLRREQRWLRTLGEEARRNVMQPMGKQ